LSARTPLPATVPTDRKLAVAVAARVGAARFGLWFEGQARFVCLGDQVVVASRNASSQDWLEHSFGPAVREAVVEVCGAGVAVRWVVDPDALESNSERGTRNAESTPEPQPEPRVASTHTAPRGRGGAGGADRASAPAPKAQTDLFGDPVAPPKPKPKRADPDAEAFARPTASPSSRTASAWGTCRASRPTTA
jgi:chromosomal replication initiator protein